MKHQILEYLQASTLQKKLIFSLRKASWFEELEKQFVQMNLPTEWNLQRKLWHYWNETNIVPLCPISGKERKWRAGAAVESIDIPGMSEGYSMFADYKVAGKGIKKLAKRTLQEKYGVDNPMDLPGMAEQRKKQFDANRIKSTPDIKPELIKQPVIKEVKPTKPGNGSKGKYNEPTKLVPFRIPVSLIPFIKNIVYTELNKHLK